MAADTIPSQTSLNTDYTDTRRFIKADPFPHYREDPPPPGRNWPCYLENATKEKLLESDREAKKLVESDYVFARVPGYFHIPLEDSHGKKENSEISQWWKDGVSGPDVVLWRAADMCCSGDC